MENVINYNTRGEAIKVSGARPFTLVIYNNYLEGEVKFYLLPASFDGLGDIQALDTIYEGDFIEDKGADAIAAIDRGFATMSGPGFDNFKVPTGYLPKGVTIDCIVHTGRCE